jgi:hypothetical protein
VTKLDRRLLTRVLSAAVALAILLASFELVRRFRAGEVQVDPAWLCA